MPIEIFNVFIHPQDKKVTRTDVPVNTIEKQKRILGFDGIRGLAALTVVVHHILNPSFDFGLLAIGVFFILSGFLITSILKGELEKIESGNSCLSRSLLNFWWRRALRIFPVYYLALFCTVWLDSNILDGALYRESIWYALFVQNFYISFISKSWGIFTHTWSIAVEQQFYVLFAPLFLLSGRRYKLVIEIFLILSIGTIYCVWYCLSFDTKELFLYTSPFAGMSYTSAGGLLALYRHQLPEFIGKQRFLAGVIAAMLLVSWHRFSVALPIKYSLQILATCGLVAHVFINNASELNAVLEWRLFRFLGNISYGLYVFHYPVYVLLQRFLPFPCDSVKMLLCVIVFSSALAVTSYYLLERRVLELKKKMNF
jgi:peptidoglycan/LPS O-acetylase OafA/YrhL